MLPLVKSRSGGLDTQVR